MTTTYKGVGNRLQYSNASGSDLSSGDVVVIGSFIAVCVTDIDNGDTGTVEITGIHTLAAIGTGAFTQGLQLYWDATSEVLTTVSSGNTKAGMAAAAKASATETADVLLNVNA